MVSSLQSCGTQCFAKGTVSALHRTQSRQDVLLHRNERKGAGGFSTLMLVSIP